MLAHAAHVDPVTPFGQHLPYGLVRRHQAALLIDHHAGQRPGPGHAAFVRLDLARQQFQQRGLARAIRPDDADPVAALDAQRKIANDRAVPETLGHFFRDDHRFGFYIVTGELEFCRACRPDHRRALGAHFPQFFKPALIALAPRGYAALQPVRFQLQLRIQLFRSARFFGVNLFFPGFITAKAHFLASQRPPVQPQRRAGQAFQEGPVMADRDKGAIEAFQPAFQPVDRRQIEVIGRLVQQQQVGLHRQHAGKRGAPPFAARGAVSRAGHVNAKLPGDRFHRMAGRGIIAR